MARVVVACTEDEASRIRPLALTAYDEARARDWPFLSDVLERAGRPASEADRGTLAAVVHGLAKYDRLLGFVCTTPDAGARFDALFAMARGEMRDISARIARIESTVERLGVEYSLPDWIVSTVLDELGEDAVAAALSRMNEPAPRFGRVNTLKSSREACLKALAEEGGPARPGVHAPHA